MYQHGKRVRQPRTAGVFLATIVVIGVVVLLAWFIIHKDISTSTAPKSNVPIITDLQTSNDATITINEDLFTMKLPKDWRLVEHKQSPEVNAYIWVATKKGQDDRRLTLHVDIMPPLHKVVKLQPLIPDGDQVLLGNLSDDCINFAGGANAGQRKQGNEPFEAKWENVIFNCDPIINNQTIGTGTADNGIATILSGTKGKHAFFFFYEDYNIHPDSSILRRALDSFRMN